MGIYATIILILSTFAFVTVRTQDVPLYTGYCESYNKATCNENRKENCVTRQKCEPTGSDVHNHCFSLWEYNAETGKSQVQMKGCFLNNKDCYEKSHCVQRNKDEINQLYFCCCNGDMCNNQNFNYTDFLDEIRMETNDVNVIEPYKMTETQVFTLLLASCVCFFMVAISFITWYYRHQKFNYESDISKAEKGQFPHYNSLASSKSQFDADLVATTKLIEKKVSGQFGAVWVGRRSDETVAVKVFPLRNRQSWQTEREVFRLPGIDHEHLLQFIGACRLDDGLDTEFWIVTSYYERGSLHDYLKENTLTWEEMHKIVLSIASGLNHLHHEATIACPLKEGVKYYKPAIAHRDFKSENVLLRADMHACIADFGLAMIFDADDIVYTRQHGRVGTARYMAPELLDGAIHFSKKSIISIDMYACGLVLWEIASRCDVHEDVCGEYQLPFEKEVGQEPTFEEIVDVVVHKKSRPSIPETWRKRPGFSTIAETIEECWDHDADARISASCVVDRIAALDNKCNNNNTIVTAV